MPDDELGKVSEFPSPEALKQQVLFEAREEFHQAEVTEDGGNGFSTGIEHGVARTWNAEHTTLLLGNAVTLQDKEISDRQNRRMVGCLAGGGLAVLVVGVLVFIMERHDTYTPMLLEVIKTVAVAGLSYYAGVKRKPKS